VTSFDREATAATLRATLIDALKLLHPFMPFVTEEIAGHYGADPLLERHYPVAAPGDARPTDEAAVAQVQAAIQALRTYRADQRIAPAQVLSATFVADDGGDEARGLYASFADAFRALSRMEIDVSPGGGDGETVVLVPGGRFEVAAPSVDRAEEANRLRAQVEKLEAEVRRSEAKLANAGFVERAPQTVIDKERAKLAAYVADRDELAARLRSLS